MGWGREMGGEALGDWLREGEGLEREREMSMGETERGRRKWNGWLTV